MVEKKERKKTYLTDELRQKIKRIEIFTKRLMKSSLVGDYLSAFKGSGLEFDQIREYIAGDDIRLIDWNSSAKMNKIMVKQLVEERDRTVILAIDVSRSSFFSSKHELKKDMIEQVAAVLAFVASNNKDRVGAVFFSDKIEKWIPPARGRVQLGKILEAIFSIESVSLKTNIKEVLNFLVGLKKRNSVVFMLSDWIDDLADYANILKVASCEYDLVGMRFLDDCEKQFPDVGFLEVQDVESKHVYIVDTAYNKKHNPINTALVARLIEQKKLFEKYKIDLLDLSVGRSFIGPMDAFFRSRIRRQI
jgi:uncharacterized protein (DUF58 family)